MKVSRLIDTKITPLGSITKFWERCLDGSAARELAHSAKLTECVNEVIIMYEKILLGFADWMTWLQLFFALIWPILIAGGPLKPPNNRGFFYKSILTSWEMNRKKSFMMNLGPVSYQSVRVYSVALKMVPFSMTGRILQKRGIRKKIVILIIQWKFKFMAGLQPLCFTMRNQKAIIYTIVSNVSYDPWEQILMN